MSTEKSEKTTCVCNRKRKPLPALQQLFERSLLVLINSIDIHQVIEFKNYTTIEICTMLDENKMSYIWLKGFDISQFYNIDVN
jgi:hypothetical protein